MRQALDHWLPGGSVYTRHARAAAASPEALWDAARAIRLADTHRLGRIVRWRIPGVADASTYHELFRGYPFTVLEETATGLVSGLCGRIWTLARDYPALAGAEEFAAWDEPGTVRVALAHWVVPLGDGRAELASEARVEALDLSARLRLKAVWTVVGPFERLVGAEPLSLAVARAQATSS
jgi:hypothetical protein